MAADRNLEVTHAGERLTVECHLVERKRFPAALLSPHHAHHKIAALFDRPLLGEHHLQGSIQIPQIGLCQKAEMARINRENRYTHRRRLTGSRQHRSVPAQHDRQGHRCIKSFWDAGAVAEHPQVLIRIGKSDHPTGTAGSDHLLTSRL